MTEPKNRIIDSRRHINSLSDEEINALLDRHLFGNPEWCTGQMVVHQSTTAPTHYWCNQCGATFDYSLTERLFGVGQHRRVVPTYTIEQIVVGIANQPHTTQFRFALAVRVTTAAGAKMSVTSVTTELLHILIRLTPRLIAGAALNAIGVADAVGHLFDEPLKGGSR